MPRSTLKNDKCSKKELLMSQERETERDTDSRKKTACEDRQGMSETERNVNV